MRGVTPTDATCSSLSMYLSFIVFYLFSESLLCRCQAQSTDLRNLQIAQRDLRIHTLRNQSADRAARFADTHIAQLIGRSRSYRKIVQA